MQAKLTSAFRQVTAIASAMAVTAVLLQSHEARADSPQVIVTQKMLGEHAIVPGQPITIAYDVTNRSDRAVMTFDDYLTITASIVDSGSGKTYPLRLQARPVYPPGGISSGGLCEVSAHGTHTGYAVFRTTSLPKDVRDSRLNVDFRASYGPGLNEQPLPPPYPHVASSDLSLPVTISREDKVKLQSSAREIFDAISSAKDNGLKDAMIESLFAMPEQYTGRYWERLAADPNTSDDAVQWLAEAFSTHAVDILKPIAYNMSAPLGDQSQRDARRSLFYIAAHDQSSAGKYAWQTIAMHVPHVNGKLTELVNVN